MAYPELVQKLVNLTNGPSCGKVAIGFDGYVDLIQKAVKSADKNGKAYFRSLADLGGHIAAAAGKSAQVELKTFSEKIGGNGPIMANALSRLGVENYCIGTLGFPELHTVFRNMDSRSSLISIGQPAVSNALEFDDGKLILSDVNSFENVSLDKIFKIYGETYLNEPLRESRLIAMVDWSNFPDCSKLWNDMFTHITTLDLPEKIYFFDLSDPSKKSAAAIQDALKIMSKFTSIGTTVLGLNENEAYKIYCALHDQEPNDPSEAATLMNEPLAEVTAFIFEKTDIDVLLVHPMDRCLVTSSTSSIEVRGRVVRHPKILTGGGDNLNAGFCFGILNHLTLQECAIVGMATSGAYVQNGHSPDLTELIQYLKTEN